MNYIEKLQEIMESLDEELSSLDEDREGLQEKIGLINELITSCQDTESVMKARMMKKPLDNHYADNRDDVDEHPTLTPKSKLPRKRR